MCKVGDGLSRPVLIARETFVEKEAYAEGTIFWLSRKAPFSYFFSSNICRGYSGEDPPLPIPNREVKLTIADGTAPPGGRVGSRGSLESQTSKDAWLSSFMGLRPHKPKNQRPTLPPPETPPLGGGTYY